MTTNPLAELNDMADPICQAVNKMRQVWDTLPFPVQSLIPVQLKAPMLAAFAAVETFDRSIGIARENGLLPPKEIK